MAVLPYRIDSTATGRYFIPEGSAASTATARVKDAVSDSSTEFELPYEMRMTQRDFKLFLVALETDEEPNDKLKALFRDPE